MPKMPIEKRARLSALPVMLSARQVQWLLRVRRSTIMEMCRSGELEGAMRLSPRKWGIPAEVARAAMERRWGVAADYQQLDEMVEKARIRPPKNAPGRPT